MPGCARACCDIKLRMHNHTQRCIGITPCTMARRIHTHGAAYKHVQRVSERSELTPCTFSRDIPPTMKKKLVAFRIIAFLDNYTAA